MQETKNEIFARRSFMLSLLQIGVTGAIVGKLGFLQVIEHKKYRLLSNKNRIKVKFHQPIRGNIYDRRGKLVAGSRQTFKVAIIAQETKNTNDTLQSLANMLGLSADYVAKIIKLIKTTPRFIPIPIKHNLTWKEVSKIEVNSLELDGVYVERYLSRYYSYDQEMSHVLGYVSPLSPKEKSFVDKRIKRIPFVQIGKYGIEKLLNDELTGKPGNTKIEIDAGNNHVRTIAQDISIKGDDYKLTIDQGLQQYVYKQLSKHESGSCLVLDVHNGDVLAMVSFPGFDPNAFVHNVTNEYWQDLQNNPYAVMTNKCINGLYPPASVIKPIIALHGLEKQLISQDTHFHCRGELKINNRYFHCWKKGGHGRVDLIQAIAQSCDCYFYNLAKQLQIKDVAQFAREFSLGVDSGINLTEERVGLIPDAIWKRKRFQQNWYLGDTVNFTIGQGYSHVSPLQMAMMMASIANGGHRITPRLFDHIKMQKQPLLIEKENIKIIQQGLYEVVNGEYGSARFHKIKTQGMTMCGKTGTSQVRSINLQEHKDGVRKNNELPWHLRDHAIFAGYAPYDNPRFAVCVVIEHGGFGSPVATPLARNILYWAQKNMHS